MVFECEKIALPFIEVRIEVWGLGCNIESGVQPLQF